MESLYRQWRSYDTGKQTEGGHKMRKLVSELYKAQGYLKMGSEYHSLNFTLLSIDVSTESSFDEFLDQFKSGLDMG